MPDNATQPNSCAEEDKLIWGARAIGAALNLDPRQTFYQLELGRVPGARKWGRKWSAPSKILRRIASGEVTP
jgi:hypothetical protein